MDRLKVGGAVALNQLYIERESDKKVLELLLAGSYVNILSSRQVGKTSLIERMRDRIDSKGAHVIVIDVSLFDSSEVPSISALFSAIVRKILKALKLPMEWWEPPETGTAGELFLEFFDRVLVHLSSDQVFLRPALLLAVVLDEVDSLLRREFSDELFVAIKAMHNNSSRYRGLSFCLVGVASPAELIKRSSTTPYNVGHTIDLRDFDESQGDDLMPLVEELSDKAVEAREMLDQVLWWTQGHPFLTIRLAKDEKLRRKGLLTDNGFVGRQTRSEFVARRFRSDDHFQEVTKFVKNRVLKVRGTARLLKRAIDGKPIRAKGGEAETLLRLSGLLKLEDGFLVVRNPLYRLVFDKQWLSDLLPRKVSLLQMGTLSASLFLALLFTLDRLYLQPLLMSAEKEKSILRDPRKSDIEAENAYHALSGLLGFKTEAQREYRNFKRMKKKAARELADSVIKEATRRREDLDHALALALLGVAISPDVDGPLGGIRDPILHDLLGKAGSYLSFITHTISNENGEVEYAKLSRRGHMLAMVSLGRIVVRILGSGEGGKNIYSRPVDGAVTDILFLSDDRLAVALSRRGEREGSILVLDSQGERVFEKHELEGAPIGLAEGALGQVFFAGNLPSSRERYGRVYIGSVDLTTGDYQEQEIPVNGRSASAWEVWRLSGSPNGLDLAIGTGSGEIFLIEKGGRPRPLLTQSKSSRNRGTTVLSLSDTELMVGFRSGHVELVELRNEERNALSPPPRQPVIRVGDELVDGSFCRGSNKVRATLAYAEGLEEVEGGKLILSRTSTVGVLFMGHLESDDQVIRGLGDEIYGMSATDDCGLVATVWRDGAVRVFSGSAKATQLGEDWGRFLREIVEQRLGVDLPLYLIKEARIHTFNREAVMRVLGEGWH